MDSKTPGDAAKTPPVNSEKLPPKTIKVAEPSTDQSAAVTAAADAAKPATDITVKTAESDGAATKPVEAPQKTADASDIKPAEPAVAATETTDAKPESKTEAPADTATVAPAAAEPANEPKGEPKVPLSALDDGHPMPSVMGGDSMIVGGDSGATYVPTDPAAKPTGGKRKKLLMGGAIAAFLLLAGAAYALLFYVPNRPANVWNTGVERTGKALEMLVDNATAANSLKTKSAYDVQGDFNLTSDYGTYDGTVTMGGDEDSSKHNLVFNMKSGEEETARTLKLDVLTQLPDSKAVYPDVFLRLSGITQLGLSGFVPNINNYDNKWIVIDSAFLKDKIGKDTPHTDSGLDTLDDQDYNELAKTFVSTSKDYVFSADPDKAVLKQGKYLGAETSEGVSTYKYEASINKDNFKKYCDALGDNIATTKAFKKLVAEADRAKNTKSFKSSCKELSGPKTVDSNFTMWVSRKDKLIHKIRLQNKDNKANYLDFGQKINGDHLTLFTKMYQDDSKATTEGTLDLNLKDYTAVLKVTSGSDSKTLSYKFTLNLTAKLTSDKVEVTKPTGAIPIQSVLDALGLSDMLNAR